VEVTVEASNLIEDIAAKAVMSTEVVLAGLEASVKRESSDIDPNEQPGVKRACLSAVGGEDAVAVDADELVLKVTISVVNSNMAGSCSGCFR
jgi:hypothetical protein